MSGIKLIVSDLDGTLLSPDHQLREAVLWRHSPLSAPRGLFHHRYGTAAPYGAQDD